MAGYFADVLQLTLGAGGVLDSRTQIRGGERSAIRISLLYLCHHLERLLLAASEKAGRPRIVDDQIVADVEIVGVKTETGVQGILEFSGEEWQPELARVLRLCPVGTGEPIVVDSALRIQGYGALEPVCCLIGIVVFHLDPSEIVRSSRVGLSLWKQSGLCFRVLPRIEKLNALFDRLPP